MAPPKEFYNLSKMPLLDEPFLSTLMHRCELALRTCIFLFLSTYVSSVLYYCRLLAFLDLTQLAVDIPELDVRDRKVLLRSQKFRLESGHQTFFLIDYPGFSIAFRSPRTKRPVLSTLAPNETRDNKKHHP